MLRSETEHRQVLKSTLEALNCERKTFPEDEQTLQEMFQPRETVIAEVLASYTTDDASALMCPPLPFINRYHG